MRKMISISIVMMSVSAASADPAAEKHVGVGIGVGIATGPNVQLATSHWGQLDFGFGSELDDRVRFQTDYAWRLVDLSSSHSVALPLYLGVGGYLTDRRWGYNDGGVRMPLGLQADFAHAPVQIFGELSPELVLVRTSDANMSPPPPPGSMALTGLMGVRAGF